MTAVRTNLPFRLAMVSEPEAACAERLGRAGFPRDIAREIAVYLAQATDLPGIADDLARDLARHGITLDIATPDDMPGRLPDWTAEPTIVWAMTDGLAYFRGSTVAPLARLAGLPVYGCGAQAQHLCQDKFASGMLARAAGLRTPATALYEGNACIAGDDLSAGAGPFFVKPNRLGAKIGVFADSLAETLPAALALSRRIEARYCDRAVVQAYIPGSDVRVSAMDLGGPLAPQLGIARMVKDPRSETGGAFLTMRDNDTLSGSRDTQGGVGGFGAHRAVAFAPALDDLRALVARGDGEVVARTVREIETMTGLLARLLGLRDYFSLDIRLGADGTPWFLEFETCPAVTIYDFQTYLSTVHRRGLGDALAASLKRVPERKAEL
jgi:D-alanine-D-alanine ligase